MASIKLPSVYRGYWTSEHYSGRFAEGLVQLEFKSDKQVHAIFKYKGTFRKGRVVEFDCVMGSGVVPFTIDACIFDTQKLTFNVTTAESTELSGNYTSSNPYDRGNFVLRPKDMVGFSDRAFEPDPPADNNCLLF